jgi:hypothetical protein
MTMMPSGELCIIGSKTNNNICLSLHCCACGLVCLFRCHGCLLKAKKAGTIARATAVCMLISQLSLYQPQTVVWMLISELAFV